MLSEARELAEQGQYARLLDLLGERPPGDIEDSPTMALFFGMAHARLGRHDEGETWVKRALATSKLSGDRSVEARALNVRGAIAFEDGRIAAAADYFRSAIEAASSLGDNVTLGLSSNNLGIIENLRGEYGGAIGSYTRALAAFQNVGNERGIVLIHHNRAITYRDRKELEKAMEEADRAVEMAGNSGDLALFAQALAGRAEIRLEAGDTRLASRDINAALAQHREISDEVGEAEDLRVLGVVRKCEGNLEEAEQLLRETILRALTQHRPLLAATAGRDIAHLFVEQERFKDAVDAARTARAQFVRLGAAVEISKIDDLLDSIV